MIQSNHSSAAARGFTGEQKTSLCREQNNQVLGLRGNTKEKENEKSD